jgi:galactose-1-phosphate uridylyltransferase
MKQLFIIIMLVGFLASGCAQSPKKVFTPLEMQTQNQFEVDKDYCNTKALEAATDEDFKYHERIEIWKKVFVGCMEIKGYDLNRT